MIKKAREKKSFGNDDVKKVSWLEAHWLEEKKCRAKCGGGGGGRRKLIA